MPETIKGECLCGASRYEISSAAKFGIQCYCSDCRHVSGGGHLPQFGVDSADFKASGAIKTYRRKSDAGSDLSFDFCADCGSPLFKRTSKAPDLIFVYPGSVTTKLEADFDTKVFEAGQQDWDKS